MRNSLKSYVSTVAITETTEKSTGSFYLAPRLPIKTRDIIRKQREDGFKSKRK